ncbi:hypothetical protein BGX30_005736, partial [Mortierella sp. GBA39]
SRYVFFYSEAQAQGDLAPRTREFVHESLLCVMSQPPRLQLYRLFVVVEKTKVGRIKVRQEWSVARKYLARSHLQSLRETAARLDTAWDSGLDAEYEKNFFRERLSRQTLENRRRKLHSVVDEVITKRQRIEYEEEKASLSEGFHSEDGSDDEDEYLQHSSSGEEKDLSAGQQTPPIRVQGHVDEVPLVENLEASFYHDNDTGRFRLSDEDQALYNEAAGWFKSKIGRDTESAIRKLRVERFREPWVHDLLYDRLKILRTGLGPQTDENTYTSFWIAPDFVALQTGVPGLISKGFVNENHFTPSAWRRALSRRKEYAKGTNVDAYYVARDNYVDIIFENVGSPTCINYAKYNVDKEKCCRNAADALLDRFYNSTGSFEVAKGYSVIFVIVFGHEVTVYTTNIKHGNEYSVSKVFQGRYHFSKDVYLANLLHLKFCLTIKTVMERNMDVSVQFGNSIESLPKEEQAHYNLQLHTTPTTGRMHLN